MVRGKKRIMELRKRLERTDRQNAKQTSSPCACGGGKMEGYTGRGQAAHFMSTHGIMGDNALRLGEIIVQCEKDAITQAAAILGTLISEEDDD